MKWIVPGLVVFLCLTGCGTASSPVASAVRTQAMQAADGGGLLNRALPPLKGIVESDYKPVDDGVADKLLARNPKTLTELMGQKVKFDGAFDWDRRWYRTGPRAIYLTRDGKRYEIDKLHGYGVWEKAIGKRVTAYVDIVELRHQGGDVVLSLAGVRYN